MKNNKSVIARMILLVFILALVVSLPAIFSDDEESGDITSVQKVVDINHDGSVHIWETIEYDFTGSYNTVSMDIPLRAPQKISNLTVDTPGYSNNVSEFAQETYDRVTVRLYSDQGSPNINDESVNITYSYDYDYGLMTYYDVAEFEYMLWKSDWSEKVGSIDLQLNLPGDRSGVEIWNNPPYYNGSITWTNSTSLNIHYDTSDAITTVEVRMIMPVDYISASDKVEVFNTSAKEKIESDQAEYLDEISYNYYKTYAVMILSVILMLTPAVIYYRYAYQPKQEDKTYHVIEPPNVDNPLILNLIVTGKLDKLDINSFYTTILDLVDRGYIKVVTTTQSEKLLEITSKDTSSLDKYESRVIEYMEKFTDENHRTSFMKIQQEENPEKFRRFINNWYYYVYDKLHSIVDISDYYQDDNNRQFKMYTAVSIIFVILVFVFILGNMDPEVTTHPLANNFLEVLGVEAIIVYFLPRRLTTHWTNKGNDIRNECDYFIESTLNYDNLKENPPDVHKCGRMITELTSLGETGEAIENIDKYLKEGNIPESMIVEDPVSNFTYNKLYYDMIDTFESINILSSDDEDDE